MSEKYNSYIEIPFDASEDEPLLFIIPENLEFWSNDSIAYVRACQKRHNLTGSFTENGETFICRGTTENLEKAETELTDAQMNAFVATPKEIKQNHGVKPKSQSIKMVPNEELAMVLYALNDEEMEKSILSPVSTGEVMSSFKAVADEKEDRSLVYRDIVETIKDFNHLRIEAKSINCVVLVGSPNNIRTAQQITQGTLHSRVMDYEELAHFLRANRDEEEKPIIETLQ